MCAGELPSPPVSSSRIALLCLFAALGCSVPAEAPTPAIDAAADEAFVPRDAARAIDAHVDDAAEAPDAPFGGGACADVPEIVAPLWLDAYEREVLGALTGVTEIAPGVRLAERRYPESRDATRTYLRAQLEAQGLAVELMDYGTGQNVIASLPATEGTADARVVLGAHFDGVRVGPAAADNGTGVTLVLAAARWITSTFPCRTRDVVFVFFDEEELGLIGSEAYATRLEVEWPPAIAVHSFDMLSWDADGDRTIELWLADDAILLDYEAAAAAHGAAVSSVHFTSSDHASFFAHRIPTVGVSEEFVGGDRTPHYHTREDTFDQVSFEFLELATVVGVDAVVREIVR
jgi:hypothetical protein